MSPRETSLAERERTGHLPLMDSIRGIAVLAILAYHAAPPSGQLEPDHPLRPIATRLDASVWIFFAVSGALLYLPFVTARLRGEPGLSVSGYAWRRVLRIIPAYWVALIVFAIWRSRPDLLTLDGFTTYFLFLQTYSTETSISGDGLGQAWSLCVEVAFYVFLPFWAIAMRAIPARSPRARLRVELGGVAFLVVLSLVWKLVVAASVPEPMPFTPAIVTLPVYLDVLALGMGLAVLYAWHAQGGGLPRPLRVLDRWPSLAWLVALAAFLVYCFGIGLSTIEPTTREQWIQRHLLSTVMGVALILPAVFGDQRRGLVRRLLRTRPLMYVGVVSYGLFLYQGAVLEQLTVWQVGAPGDSRRYLTWMVTATAFGLLIATVSWYGLERPAMRLKRRFRLRGGASAAPAGVRAPATGSEVAAARDAASARAAEPEPEPELSPALRPPPGNPRFPLADGMRGIAVLLVVLAHCAAISGASGTASWNWIPLNASSVGVALFFAISGFLLYRPFVSEHAGLRRAPALRDYARRRFLRIVPGYWTALTLLAVFPGIVGVLSGDWWVYYGFLQVYSDDTLGKGIPIAWSVCVEVTFYLALPFIAWTAARLTARTRSRPWWHAQVAVIGGFAVAGVAGRYLKHAGVLPEWSGATLAANADWLAWGMALAVASVAVERGARLPRAVRRLPRPAALAWLAAGLAFAAVALGLDVPRRLIDPAGAQPGALVRTLNHVLLGAVATLLLVPAALGASGAVRRVLAWRPLVYVGLVSYGVYLWHVPIAAWLADWHPPGGDGIPGVSAGGLGVQDLVPAQPTLTLLVATLAISIPVAAASYRSVELPFLRLKDRPLLPLVLRALRRPAEARGEVPAGATATAAPAAETR